MNDVTLYVDSYVPNQLEVKLLQVLNLEHIDESLEDIAWSSFNPTLGPFDWLISSQTSLMKYGRSDPMSELEREQIQVLEEKTDTAIKRLHLEDYFPKGERLSYNFIHAIVTRLLYSHNPDYEDFAYRWLLENSYNEQLIRQILWDKRKVEDLFNSTSIRLIGFNPHVSEELFCNFFDYTIFNQNKTNNILVSKMAVDFYLEVIKLPDRFANEKIVSIFEEHNFSDLLAAKVFVPYFRKRFNLDASVPDSWVQRMVESVYPKKWEEVVND